MSDRHFPHLLAISSDIRFIRITFIFLLSFVSLSYHIYHCYFLVLVYTFTPLCSIIPQSIVRYFSSYLAALCRHYHLSPSLKDACVSPFPQVIGCQHTASTSAKYNMWFICLIEPNNFQCCWFERELLSKNKREKVRLSEVVIVGGSQII